MKKAVDLCKQREKTVQLYTVGYIYNTNSKKGREVTSLLSLGKNGEGGFCLLSISCREKKTFMHSDTYNTVY